MNALWRDHPATNAQNRLAFPSRKQAAKRLSQADVILAMLRAARVENRALELPEILQTGIAQFTARIFELREQGFVIENELRRSREGRVLSRYWLRYDPNESEGA